MNQMLQRVVPSRNAIAYGICMGVAALLAFGPEYAGLPEAGRRGFFILLSSAGLWVTEAIPPFAAGLQLIGLAIALLGRPGGVFGGSHRDHVESGVARVARYSG